MVRAQESISICLCLSKSASKQLTLQALHRLSTLQDKQTKYQLIREAHALLPTLILHTTLQQSQVAVTNLLPTTRWTANYRSSRMLTILTRVASPARKTISWIKNRHVSQAMSVLSKMTNSHSMSLEMQQDLTRLIVPESNTLRKVISMLVAPRKRNIITRELTSMSSSKLQRSQEVAQQVTHSRKRVTYSNEAHLRKNDTPWGKTCREKVALSGASRL